MMSNSTLAFGLLLVLAAAGAGQEPNPCPPPPYTLYSRRATLLDMTSERRVRLTSPDGSKVLTIRVVEGSGADDKSHLEYSIHTKSSSFRALLYGFGGEVGWSPDSKAFAVTQTEGGGGLGSRVYVFYVGEAGLRKLDVSGPIEKHFGRPVKCEVPVLPNTGFISWGADSSTLLVAAEVVPVSICKCSGTYRVYEMQLPSLTIMRTYSQTEAKKAFWGSLGCELRVAHDNKCVEILESAFSSRRVARP